MRGERFLGAAVVALWVAAACGDSDPPQSEDPPVDLDCEPGDTRPCEGVPECGTPAIQTCFPSGVGWSACTCYRGEGGANSGGAGGEAGDSSAGEAGDSSAGGSDSSAGGSSAGGSSAGGSSAGGSSAGGSSAGGSSAGGSSAGGSSAGGATGTSMGGTGALAGAAGQAGEGP